MALAGALEIELSANVARLQQDMQAARGAVSSTMQSIERSVASAKAALAGLGLTVGVGAFAGLIKGAIDAADHLGDLSKTTRIAVEDLAGLRFASKQTGADLETTAGSINKLAVNMGKESERFRELGVTAREPIEAFKQLADATNAITDPQQRAAVLAEALGKGWERAAPLLAEGSKKIGEMVDEGKKLSGVNAELVAQADEFNDKLVKIAGNGAGVNAVLAQMLPLLNATADGILANGKSTTMWEVAGKALAEILRVLIVVGGNVVFVLRGIRDEIVGIATQVVAVAHGDFAGAAEIGREMKANAEANRTAFDAWEKSIMGVGAVTTSVIPVLDSADQVSRRAASDASAAARAFLSKGEAATKAAKAVKELADADAHVIEWMKFVQQVSESVNRALLEGENAYRKHIQAIDDAIAQEKFANDTRGMTRAQIEALTVARMEDRLEILRNDGAMESELQQLQDEINKRKQLRDVIATGEADVAANQAQLQALHDQVSVWNELGDRTGRFFSDLITSGRNAFDVLRDSLKSFAGELIAFFAKRFVLQIGATLLGGTGAGAALAGQAATLGSGSMVGSLAGAALGAAGEFSSALAGTFVGPVAEGFSMAGLGQGIAGLVGAIPVWGQIALGIAAIVGILSSMHKGGPKAEGQFITGGAPGFNIVGTSANDMAQKFATSIEQGFLASLKALGGTSGGFQFGAGIVRDPSGTAPTFLDTLLRSNSGQELLRQHNANVGRSDEDLKAEMELQSQRVILAALQNSTLPPLISGIINSISASSATLEEINAVITQAQQAQALWTQFEQMFSTDAEKLAAARTSVENGFKALGISVPTSSAEFAKLVRGLDLSTDAGREMFQALMAIAPAFKAVEDASSAAAEQMKQDWESVQQSIDTLTGRNRGPGQLAALTGQFQAANSQFAGLTPDQLVSVLSTITEQDFANYSEENQKLIRAILELAAGLKENTTAVVQQQNTLYNPAWVGSVEQRVQQYTQGFSNAYSGIIGEQPTLMDKFTLQVQLMQQQLAVWQQQYASSVQSSGPYSPQSQALEQMIQSFKQLIGGITTIAGHEFGTGLVGDIAKLTTLTAQYGQQKAEQLFDLQKWYDAQKALVGSSATAMDALNEIFQTKWNEILQGVASSSAFDNAKERLGEWWRKLFLNEQLSPLTLQQRFAEAKSQYQSTLALAQSGDVNAIGNLSGISETVLQLARQLMASSPAYTALFREISAQTAGIAGISDTEVNSRLYSALPTSSTMASSADIAGLRSELADLTTVLVEQGIKVSEAPTVEAAVTQASSDIKASTNEGLFA